MEINLDRIIVWHTSWFTINATIFNTWIVMFLLVVASYIITSRLTTDSKINRWQNLLEIIIEFLQKQIYEITMQKSTNYLPFIGTLFLFIACSNILGIVPWYRSPTGSISTTTALAICVFAAVPIYGITKQGLRKYLKSYIDPSLFMLPFKIIGEVSRTLALAVRLYGNVMSGAIIIGILLSIMPFLFPIVMNLLGLLTGLIQAYIFAILAMVYIASATRVGEKPTP